MKRITLLVFGLLLLVFATVNASASELLYAHHINGSLSIVDTNTNGLITSFSVGQGAWVIANPAGTYVYTNDFNGDKINVIQTGTNQIVKTISINGPSGMAITNDGNTMYVAMSSDDKIAIINLRTYTITGYINVGDDPYAIALTPDNSKLYVGCYNDTETDMVQIISTSTNTVTDNLPYGPGIIGPCDFAFSNDGSKIFVLTDQKYTGNGRIDVFNTNGHAWISNIDMDHKNWRGGLDIEPGGSYIWVVNYDGDSITAYSTSTYTKLKEVELPVVGKGVFDIRASETNKLYVAQDDTIRVYNINTGNITANITPNAGQIYRLDIFNPSDTIPQYSAQPVYLYVHSYYVLRWENVTLSIYDNGTLLDSKQTDNNGAATFNLVPGTLYTINAYSASLGINTTVNYTVPNSYSGSIQQGIMVLPYTSWLNPNYSGGMTNVNNSTVTNASFASGYQDRDIFLNTNTSRTSATGYINNSYKDLSRLTTGVTFYLYKLNTTSNNYTVVQTAGINLNTTVNSTWCNFTVTNVDASNRDYYVKAEASNSYYGNVTRNNPARIPWQSLLPGVPEQWHTYLAVIIVIGIFAASVMWLNGIISLVGAGAAYIFYSLGWLDTVPGAALGVTGAIIAAIVYYWSRRETGGLE